MQNNINLSKYVYIEPNFFQRHGTGHGIGAYGNIHEGPTSVRPTKEPFAPSPLRENMFFSDEPGYYEDGVYGIRLETIVRVVRKEQSLDGTYGECDFFSV